MSLSCWTSRISALIPTEQTMDPQSHLPLVAAPIGG